VAYFSRTACIRSVRVVEMKTILDATDLAADFPLAVPYAISLAQENQARILKLLSNSDTPTLASFYATTQYSSPSRRLSSRPSENSTFCRR
jgi:hypothetical protein